jgi:hypothetical protein
LTCIPLAIKIFQGGKSIAGELSSLVSSCVAIKPETYGISSSSSIDAILDLAQYKLPQSVPEK